MLGKAGFRVLCTLRRPLSMASCSLKAYGLKWQWGAGDAKAIISPSCTPAGKRRVLSRNKGREGGQEWQEVSDCHIASQHTCTDCWIYYRVGFQTSISLKVLRAEIMSVLLFSLSPFVSFIDAPTSENEELIVFGADWWPLWTLYTVQNPSFIE